MINKTKYIKIILIGFVSLLLSACSSQKKSTIDFNDYTMELNSSKTFTGNQLLGNPKLGIKVFTEIIENTEEKTFVNSIITFEKETNKQNLKNFINHNAESIVPHISGFNYTKVTNQSFVCNGTYIAGVIREATHTQDKIITYYTQYYFIQNTKGYIISISSQEKSIIKQFIKSIKNIKCKK